jgi:hypothetical protein
MKSIITSREKLEESFKRAGLDLLPRERAGNYELFIGDGFSSAPHFQWQRFGVEPGEFPAGMFVTFWWLGKDVGSTVKLHIGRPMFMNLSEFRREARVNAARKDAKAALKRLKRAH